MDKVHVFQEKKEIGHSCLYCRTVQIRESGISSCVSRKEERKSIVFIEEAHSNTGRKFKDSRETWRHWAHHDTPGVSPFFRTWRLLCSVIISSIWIINGRHLHTYIQNWGTVVAKMRILLRKIYIRTCKPTGRYHIWTIEWSILVQIRRIWSLWRGNFPVNVNALVAQVSGYEST